MTALEVVRDAAAAFVARAHHVDRCPVRHGRACTCGKHALLDALAGAGVEVEPSNPRDARAAGR